MPRPLRMLMVAIVAAICLTSAAFVAPALAGDPDQELDGCLAGCKGMSGKQERIDCAKQCIRDYKKAIMGGGGGSGGYGSSLDQGTKDCLKECKAKYQPQLSECKGKPSKIEKYLCLKALANEVQACADNCSRQ